MDASATFERIRGFVSRRRDHLATPGLALAVTDRERCLGVILDGLADAGSREPLAEHHRFQIASISKGFTALAVLQLAEDGRLDLHAPVRAALPWFAIRSNFGPITVHHLLSHTSGLVTGSDFTGDGPSEVWSLRETETGFAPGERFHYSNVGYKTLGLVLEAVTGEPWWATVRRRILRPIGMGEVDVVIDARARAHLAAGHTSPLLDRPWLPRHGFTSSTWFDSATADGTICATAEELTAYARLLLAGGAGVISSSSFASMTTPVLEDPPGSRTGYGYGVKWVGEEGRRLLGHSGGMIGFSSYVLVDPAAGFGAVVLTNSVFGAAYEVCTFALACAAASAARDGLPDIAPPPDPYRVVKAESFAGRYQDGGADVEVVTASGGLSLRTEGRTARLASWDEDPEGVFVVDDPELDRYELRFLREEDGLVAGAFWGPRWLRHERARDAAERKHPPEWARYPGRYASWNPWMPGFRVFLRRGELWLSPTGDASDGDGERRVVPEADGRFRVGEPWSPDRVRFDMEIGGVTHRAVYDAAPFYRTFAE